MSASNIILPAPTLMIAIGHECADIAKQSQAILCRAEPRRASILGLLEMESDQAEESKAVSFQKKLEDMIHRLRLHEKLIQIGLGDEPDLPLNIVVLADLTDEPSLQLYPVLDAINELLLAEPNSDAFLLLKTIIFDPDVEDKKVRPRLHLHLQKLQARASDADWAFQIYLFDQFKEGVWEVKDEVELNVLVGNFLLALLSGRFAQQITHRSYAIEARERKAYFNSVGVTALISDPKTLQDICALKMGKEILDAEFLHDSPMPPHVIEHTLSSVNQHLGTLYEWEETLCKETICKPIRQRGVSLDLSLANLDFENLPMNEWQDEITGYASYFEREVSPREIENLRKNFDRLAEDVGRGLQAEMDLLPSREGIYPGMLSVFSQVIQETAKILNQRMQECLSSGEEDKVSVALDSEYETSLRELERAVSALPEPPRWIRLLPAPLCFYAKNLFTFLFLRKEHNHLLALREQAVEALKRKLAFPLEQEVGHLAIDLCHQSLDILEKANEALKQLRLAVQSVLDELTKEQKIISGADSPFRVYVLDRTLIEWACSQAKSNPEEIFLTLLKNDYLVDWREISAEKLYQPLHEICEQAYEELMNVSAEESLAHWNGEDKEAVVAKLVQGAVPLLRPNFDLEGDSPSYQSFYCLCDEPRTSDILHGLDASSRDWQLISTGDPYLVTFCRVRQLISIKSVDFLMHRAAAAFEQLGKQEQKALQDSFETVPGKAQL